MAPLRTERDVSDDCMFDLAVRVIAADGTTERIDFNDHDAGLAVINHQEPEENVRDIRASAARVDGSYRVAEADDDGFLNLFVRVSGSTWGECTARWETARAAYRAESFYFLEIEEEGVTKRWRTERPDVVPSGIDSMALANKRQTYQLRFRVQPNPTVSVA